jgi:hypothetical protein
MDAGGSYTVYNARTALILAIIALILGAFGSALGVYSVVKDRT